MKRILTALEITAHLKRLLRKTEKSHKKLKRSWKKLLKEISEKKICDRRNKITNLLIQNNIYFEILQNKNIIDIIVPAKTKDVILLTAHYDVIPDSFGYNDNGSGVVCLLQLIKKLPSNVEVVFTDGEENGGLGVDEYIKATNKKISCVINLDVVGLKGIILADNNIWLIQDCLKDCKVGKMPFNDGDVFKEYKIPTVTLSVAPEKQTFGMSINKIFDSIHNNKHDNKLNMIHVSSMKKVSNKVLEIIHFINSSSGRFL